MHDARVVSVLLEKQQVQVLADRMGLLLEEVHRRFGTAVPPEAGELGDLSPLLTPLDVEFRVGTMGLGWDAEAESVVVELLAVSETEFDESVVLDDAEEGPDAVRVFLTPIQGASSRCGPSAWSPRGVLRARCAASRSPRTATSAFAPTDTGGSRDSIRPSSSEKSSDGGVDRPSWIPRPANCSRTAN